MKLLACSAIIVPSTLKKEGKRMQSGLLLKTGLVCVVAAGFGELLNFLAGRSLQEATALSPFNLFFLALAIIALLAAIFKFPKTSQAPIQNTSAKSKVEDDGEDETEEDEEEAEEYKPCPDCRKPVNTSDSFCPSCGYCLKHRHLRDSCNVCDTLFYTNQRRKETGNQEFVVRFCPNCGQRSRQIVDATGFESS
ncbi:MAG: zinc-ribbon domain-containing protein [Patescibacteria group bacterium]|nr:zinc-ribbon domain-containing protein [Patescibacteria group bacterium]